MVQEQVLLARILLDQLDISRHRCGHLRQTRRLAFAAAVSTLHPRPCHSALPPAAPLRLFLNFFSTNHNWYQLIPVHARGFRHIPSQDKTETGRSRRGKARVRGREREKEAQGGRRGSRAHGTTHNARTDTLVSNR